MKKCVAVVSDRLDILESGVLREGSVSKSLQKSTEMLSNQFGEHQRNMNISAGRLKEDMARLKEKRLELKSQPRKSVRSIKYTPLIWIFSAPQR